MLKAVIEQRLSSQIAEGARQVAEHDGSCAELLLNVLATWWEQVFNSDASGVFKLIITEVRNFPDIAEFYFREVVEPGQNLIGSVVQRGIERGEFRPVDVNIVVHSLVLPMVMLCIHKHSLGACGCGISDALEPHRFIRQHIELLLLPTPNHRVVQCLRHMADEQLQLAGTHVTHGSAILVPKRIEDVATRVGLPVHEVIEVVDHAVEVASV